MKLKYSLSVALVLLSCGSQKGGSDSPTAATGEKKAETPPVKCEGAKSPSDPTGKTPEQPGSTTSQEPTSPTVKGGAFVDGLGGQLNLNSSAGFGLGKVKGSSASLMLTDGSQACMKLLQLAEESGEVTTFVSAKEDGSVSVIAPPTSLADSGLLNVEPMGSQGFIISVKQIQTAHSGSNEQKSLNNPLILATKDGKLSVVDKISDVKQHHVTDEGDIYFVAKEAEKDLPNGLFKYLKSDQSVSRITDQNIEVENFSVNSQDIIIFSGQVVSTHQQFKRRLKPGGGFEDVAHLISDNQGDQTDSREEKSFGRFFLQDNALVALIEGAIAYLPSPVTQGIRIANEWIVKDLKGYRLGNGIPFASEELNAVDPAHGIYYSSGRLATIDTFNAQGIPTVTPRTKMWSNAKDGSPVLYGSSSDEIRLIKQSGDDYGVSAWLGSGDDSRSMLLTQAERGAKFDETQLTQGPHSGAYSRPVYADNSMVIGIPASVQDATYSSSSQPIVAKKYICDLAGICSLNRTGSDAGGSYRASLMSRIGSQIYVANIANGYSASSPGELVTNFTVKSMSISDLSLSTVSIDKSPLISASQVAGNSLIIKSFFSDGEKIYGTGFFEDVDKNCSGQSGSCYKRFGVATIDVQNASLSFIEVPEMPRSEDGTCENPSARIFRAADGKKRIDLAYDQSCTDTHRNMTMVLNGSSITVASQTPTTKPTISAENYVEFQVTGLSSLSVQREWSGSSYFGHGQVGNAYRSYRFNLANGQSTRLNDLDGVQVYEAGLTGQGALVVNGNEVANNKLVFLKYDPDGTFLKRQDASGVKLVTLLPIPKD